MKLKLNKACDLGSISVLPPRRTGGSGGAGSSAAAAAGSQHQQQQRSQQTQSQQSFSQVGGGGVGSGGGASHLQSQLSQASFDENLLSLRLASPARDQKFGFHDGSSKKKPSLPVSSASCVPEESQLQLAMVSSNAVNRWNPSLPDSRSQVPNEDVERKFQHLASSVHKMGMVLDSVQSDAMQLNRAMKEASLDSGSIQQKVVLLENSLQKIIKEQDELKALVESSTKSNSEQLIVLNSHSSKLDTISSILSVWPKQIQADLRQQQSDIFRIFTKEMEGIVRAVRSLNSRPAAVQMLADQCCTTNGRPQLNQTPVATLGTQTPVENGRLLVSQTPVAHGKPMASQKPAAKGKTLTSQKPPAKGRPQMNQIPAASGRPQTNQVAAPKVDPAPLVCASKATGPKLKVEQGKVKTLPQKLTGSGNKVAPKEEEVPNRRTSQRVAAGKAVPLMIILDSDDESDGLGSCVILKTQTGGKEEEAELIAEVTDEESLEILQRARKRRRREMQAIVPA